MTVDSRLRDWSQATYATIHALKVMKALDLGNIARVGYSVQESLTWLVSDLGYSSNVPEKAFSPERISLGRESEDALFAKVTRLVATQLLLALVSLLDEGLEDLLLRRALRPRRYPSQRLSQLEGAVPKWTLHRHAWAFAGAREVIVVRNALVHAGGRWNAETIAQLRAVVRKPPQAGRPLSISFGDLLRFKRAVRTVLNVGQPPQHGTAHTPRPD